VTKPAQAGHRALRAADVVAQGGWHPGYVRVLAVASDGDHAFALVDGNGDGAELEAEAWLWDSGQWTPGSSSGAGPLDGVGPVATGGEAGEARYAYGRTQGREAVVVSFERRRYEVPVGPHGVWAFVKVAADPASCAVPTLAS
jgi:hypothetical protein